MRLVLALAPAEETQTEEEQQNDAADEKQDVTQFQRRFEWLAARDVNGIVVGLYVSERSASDSAP